MYVIIRKRYRLRSSGMNYRNFFFKNETDGEHLKTKPERFARYVENTRARNPRLKNAGRLTLRWLLVKKKNIYLYIRDTEKIGN